MGRLERTSKKRNLEFGRYGPEGLINGGEFKNRNISEKLIDEADEINNLLSKIDLTDIDLDIIKSKIDYIEDLSKNHDKCDKLRNIINGLGELSEKESKYIIEKLDSKIEQLVNQLKLKDKSKEENINFDDCAKDNNNKFLEGLQSSVKSEEDIDYFDDCGIEDNKEKSKGKDKSNDNKTI